LQDLVARVGKLNRRKLQENPVQTQTQYSVGNRGFEDTRRIAKGPERPLDAAKLDDTEKVDGF